jgi:hypothetical protein
MTNIPKTIYLQIGEECSTDEDFNNLSEVSWCAEKIFENDIEYVLKLSYEDLYILKQIRNYFGENDAAIFNQTAFSVIDRIIKNERIYQK